jgi:ureidoacrylate peracid hydrolase
MESSKMLANTFDLVAKVRKLGATIIFTPITFTDDYHELPTHPYGILKDVVDSKSFRKGTWGAEIVDVLKSQPQDIIIEGKRGLCGFASTNTVGEEEQRLSIEKNYPMFSRVMTHTEFLEALAG